MLALNFTMSQKCSCCASPARQEHALRTKLRNNQFYPVKTMTKTLSITIACILLVLAVIVLNTLKHPSPGPGEAQAKIAQQQANRTNPTSRAVRESEASTSKPPPTVGGDLTTRINKAGTPPKITQNDTAPKIELSSKQVWTEFRGLLDEIAAAETKHVKSGKTVANLPTYGALRLNPAEESIITELEKKAAAIIKRAAPEAKQDVEKANENFLRIMKHLKQFSLVEVILSPEGFAELQITRTNKELVGQFNQWGSFEAADRTQIDDPVMEYEQSSTGWSAAIEKLYGDSLPSKIKETMAAAKANAKH